MGNTALICCGYSTSAWLKIGENDSYTKISVTSYSATLNSTVMQSKAALAYAASVRSDWRRTKGPYILDVPTVDLSLSFEINRSLLKKIVNVIACSKTTERNNGDSRDVYSNKRNTRFWVKIMDHASSVNLEFSECYLTKFSFSISKDSILAVSMDFQTVQQYIGYSWVDRTNPRFGPNNILPVETTEWSNQTKEEFEKEVIPYYDWAFKRNGSETYDIVDLSFSYTQSVEPKFTCSGSKSKIAPAPTSVLFGLPSISLGMDVITAHAGSVGFGSSSAEQGLVDQYDNTNGSLENNTFSMRLRKKGYVGWDGGEGLMKMTGVHLVSFSPQRDAFPTAHKEYLVNGLLVNEIPES